MSWLLVPLAMRVAIRAEVIDRPGGYKAQADPVPYLGGIAIVLAFAAVVLSGAAIRPPVSGFDELAVILLGGVVLSLLGLVDDLRGLGPYLRLTVIVAVALAAVSTGITVRLFDAGGPVDVTITILWIVGITNAFNLLDNMDGLSAGIAMIGGASIGVIAALHGQFLVAVLAFAIAGCALGFLRHNFEPAKIYMGDAGSLFLGFVLSVLALRLRFPAPREVTAFIPLVVLAVPILDTTLVTISRLRHGRNPLAGGRDHLSHRLVFVGLSVRRAVICLYTTAAILGWTALIISRLDVVSARLLVGLTVVLLSVIGVMLGRVPIYSNSERRKIVLIEVAKHEDDYVHERGRNATAEDLSTSSDRVASGAPPG